MAKAFLLSHGARQPGAGDTFVPEGKSISFYSEYDENTLRSIGLAAVNNGDVQPVDTFVGPATLPNYLLVQFEDSAIAQHLASESSQTGGKLYFVGQDMPSPTRLCTSPATCAGTKPQHAPSCQGVFKTITEEEIFSVSCRGVLGGAGTSTRKMEGSTDFVDENKAEGQRILEWAKTEPKEAMDYWQSLTDATRTMIGSNYVPVRTFAENYFKGGGESTQSAVLDARRFLEGHDEESFFDYYQQMDPKQQAVVRTDDDLRVIVEKITRSRLGLTGGGGGDQFAKQVETVKSQATTLAQAVSSFTEDGGGDIDGVTTAFGTFMNDVQALQKMAEGKPAERAAVSLYSAGADAGTKTALFKESPSAETLSEVKSAFANVAQAANEVSAG